MIRKNSKAARSQSTRLLLAIATTSLAELLSVATPCPPTGCGGTDPTCPIDPSLSSTLMTVPSACANCDANTIKNGLAIYWVSEPALNLRIEVPLSEYAPALGPTVSFNLSYRQRADVLEDAVCFGVGTNWSLSLRAYVMNLTASSPGLVRLHRGGGGFVDYYDGTPQFREGSIMHVLDSGQTYELDWPNGAKDLFQTPFTNGSGIIQYYLSQQVSPNGNSINFSYAITGGIFKLVSITDADGATNSLYYENGSFPNRVTKYVDRYSRTNTLAYDSDGFPTNASDISSGITTAFQYDRGTRRGWITNMATSYGTTRFRHGGVDADLDTFMNTNNLVNRFVEVTLPTGGKELYLFRLDCSNILSQTYASVPSTSPLTNTLDNVDQHHRNSFHWGPLQYSGLSSSYQLSGNVSNLTSTDYSLARLRHWLIDPASGQPAYALSVERNPSPDGVTAGQLVWYDYAAKANGNNYAGSSALPILEAQVLPDSTTRFQSFGRNTYANVTNQIATYTAANGSVALRTNRFIFGTNGIDLVEHVGPNGEQVVSNYFGNAYHQPDASYDALNQATLYTYNANRQVASIKDPSGLTTSNSYVGSGPDINRLSTAIDLEIGRTNSFNYTNGLVYWHKDERGLSTTNFWDGLRRLVGVKYADGTSISNIYTALDLSATKDRLGYWTHTAYNGMRQKIAETNANGAVTLYSYCDCGALLSITDALQQVTSFDYDFQGNLIFVNNADGYDVTNVYNSLRQLTSVADGTGSRSLYYNNQGLLTSVTNAYGAQGITTFDLEDRPIYVTDSNGTTVTNSYDKLGRVITKIYPNGSSGQFAYSAQGLTAYTNQIGLPTRYTYDVANRNTGETNANGEVIIYTYGTAGDLLSITDGKGQTTHFGVDEFGRITNKLDQAGVEILRYKYDQSGRLTNRWSAAMGNTYYSFDPVGNLTNISYPNSLGVSFAFNPLNQLTNMNDAIGTTKYTYTSAGQLFTEDGPFANDTVTNFYVNQLRTGLVLQQPTGTWTNKFVFDAANRLSSVTSPAGTFTYLYAGGLSSVLPVKISLPNTSYITNTYDNVARLTGTYLKNSGNSVLDSYAYIYDAANRRTNLTRADASTVAYKYDNIGQLTIADSSVDAEDLGYSYDAGWNLTRKTNTCATPGSTDTYTMDNKNELTNAYIFCDYGNHDATYDANGNLTSLNLDSSALIKSYFYDDENRLAFWTLSLSGKPLTWWDQPQSASDMLTQFLYDGLGRLRQRLEYTNDVEHSTGWALAAEVQYVYDGWRVIQERDSDNSPTVSYTRGNDLSGSLEGAGGIGGLLARSDSYSSGNWTEHNYYFADGNGNITYMLNSSQSMVARYRYEPFGNLISSSGTLADANIYRFSSKEVHLGSGIYYYGYRFYDPQLQRWINRDPLRERASTARLLNISDRPLPQTPVEFLQEANLFEFVGQNPVIFFDPLGLTFPFKRSCTPQEMLLCRGQCSQYGVKVCFVWEYYDDKGNKIGESKVCICNTPRNSCH